MAALLEEARDETLFVSGCVSNQGRFYDRFDAVVLLTAPAHILLARVATRAANEYGKTEAERAEILDHLSWVEPRLRATATHVLDATRPLREVADELERIAVR
jgi:thymidylate kinase